MIDYPEVIMLYGVEARRLPLRGMTDYQRGNGNAVYETADKHRLMCVHGKWRAQYKNYTTKYYSSIEEATEQLHKLINNLMVVI
jgi:hypothetical protein